jgi:5'-nucleotidase
MLVNVNVPACPAAKAAGVAVTRQGRRDSELMQIEERRDGRGIPYYWLKFTRGGFEPEIGSDIEALAANKVSITPLSLNLTDEATRVRYAAAFASG